MKNDLQIYYFPRLEARLDVAVYGCSQHADKERGVWVMNDARYSRFKLQHIMRFREANEDDKRNYLLTNTVVPTDYCMMDCYDEWDKKDTSLMVVGNAEELNKRLNEIRGEVREKDAKLYDLFKKL